MQLVIDRIEDGIAVCEELETGARYEYKLNELPQSVREGDLLSLADGNFTPDPEATRKRREYMQSLLDDAFG